MITLKAYTDRQLRAVQSYFSVFGPTIPQKLTRQSGFLCFKFHFNFGCYVL